MSLAGKGRGGGGHMQLQLMNPYTSLLQIYYNSIDNRRNEVGIAETFIE